MYAVFKMILKIYFSIINFEIILIAFEKNICLTKKSFGQTFKVCSGETCPRNEVSQKNSTEYEYLLFKLTVTCPILWKLITQKCAS